MTECSGFPLCVPPPHGSLHFCSFEVCSWIWHVLNRLSSGSWLKGTAQALHEAALFLFWALSQMKSNLCGTWAIWTASPIRGGPSPCYDATSLAPSSPTMKLFSFSYLPPHRAGSPELEQKCSFQGRTLPGGRQDSHWQVGWLFCLLGQVYAYNGHHCMLAGLGILLMGHLLLLKQPIPWGVVIFWFVFLRAQKKSWSQILFHLLGAEVFKYYSTLLEFLKKTVNTAIFFSTLSTQPCD